MSKPRHLLILTQQHIIIIFFYIEANTIPDTSLLYLTYSYQQNTTSPQHLPLNQAPHTTLPFLQSPSTSTSQPPYHNSQATNFETSFSMHIVPPMKFLFVWECKFHVCFGLNVSWRTNLKEMKSWLLFWKFSYLCVPWWYMIILVNLWFCDAWACKERKNSF